MIDYLEDRLRSDVRSAAHVDYDAVRASQMIDLAIPAVVTGRRFGRIAMPALAAAAVAVLAGGVTAATLTHPRDKVSPGPSGSSRPVRPGAPNAPGPASTPAGVTCSRVLAVSSATPGVQTITVCMDRRILISGTGRGGILCTTAICPSGGHGLDIPGVVASPHR